MAKIDYIGLFLELAKPDKNGISRWVNVDEFVGKFAPLKIGNGLSWGRRDGNFAKQYIIETDKSITPGNRIDRIRLNGFNNDNSSNQIRNDIKEYYKNKACVILGTTNRTEVDHKNGRKNDPRVMNINTQTLNDFQPLSKHANDAKRQFCKECIRTNKRYDAKQLGYQISFYKGNETHDGTDTGCEGCFWYDPIEFRKHLQEKK